MGVAGKGKVPYHASKLDSQIWSSSWTHLFRQNLRKSKTHDELQVGRFWPKVAVSTNVDSKSHPNQHRNSRCKDVIGKHLPPDLRLEGKSDTNAWLANELTKMSNPNAPFMPRHPHLILSLIGAARISLALDPEGKALVQSIKFA